MSHYRGTAALRSCIVASIDVSRMILGLCVGSLIRLSRWSSGSVAESPAMSNDIGDQAGRSLIVQDRQAKNAK